MTPFCTIFLPVRNGGDHVEIAVRSVLAQSDPDWRLVVFENASTDRTADRLLAFTDQRITIVPAERPLTMFDNWDRGRATLASGAAAGELVTFLGHDDWFYPNFLGDVRSLVEQHPQASLYQVPFDLVDGEGRLTRPAKPIPRREVWQDLAASICWGLRDSFGSGYLFRPADYLQVGGIPNLPMLLASDDLLFIRLTALGYKACGETAGCAYRLHRGSASGAISPARIEAHIDALDIFVRVMRDEFQFTAIGEGRAALACLIARELRPYDTALVRRRLSANCRIRLDNLLSTQLELAPDVRTANWLGSNVVTSDLYIVAKRLFLSASMLRSGTKRP